MEKIKYLNKGKNFDGNDMFDIEKNYGNECAEVFFRIEVKENVTKDQFNQDTEKLFNSIGWHIVNDGRSCNTAKSNDYSLYLHPNHFKGYVLKNDIKAIAELLNGADTFTIRWVDVCETVYNMSDEEYEKYLQTKDSLIKEKLFEVCKTSRSHLFHNSLTIIMEISNIVRLTRLGVEDGEYDGKGQTGSYIEKIIKQMEETGYLITEKNNSLLRSINKTEQKKLKLNPVFN